MFNKSHPKSRDDKGSMLIAAVAIVATMVLIIAAVINQGKSNFEYSATRVHQTQLHYAANAGISQVRYHVGNATYNNDGNSWLQNSGHIMSGGQVTANPPVATLLQACFDGQHVAVVNANQLQFDIGPATVRVYVYNLGNRLYRAISFAQHKVTGEVVVRAMDLSERASFARYIFFREQSLYFGKTTTAGDVHSNDRVTFSEEFHSYGPLTAVDGFAYQRNAVAPGQSGENVFFHGTSDGGTDTRDRPVVQALQELKNGILNSSSPYMIEQNPSSSNFWRSSHGMKSVTSVEKMHFDGNNVKIQVKGKNNAGQTITSTTVTLPLPQAGLIFTDRQVRSLEGSLSGRVTLAVDYGNSSSQNPSSSNESVRLTGNLQYTDSNGEHPYELYPVDSAGNKGSKIADLNSTGNYVPWEPSSGYVYDKNPNYLQNASQSVPPVLGIIAKGRIRTTENAPHNMVFHGATISINSAWTSTYHPSLAPGNPSTNSLKKGNWRHLGAKIAKGGGGRYSTSGSYPYPGYSASGEYLYDDRLRTTPPPHFLSEDRPSFGPSYNPKESRVITQTN
ncbi:MAG: hypothetical protein P1V97_06125 [Planctomycetota bacterium]|nr:hypothetical protein [Planctomycetota bacterium]